ncbi:hypothetical protein CIG75_12780 [Tumebacillus algifaecis]|uniref:Uncharacterized protein n=1 Tax=Tumebacillus algifaecis TaxID=1214604 RepID=A0A223D301_9BACL|nr:hypothetical protein CIG75_12780 [Tumebacillus algifaecis]
MILLDFIHADTSRRFAEHGVTIILLDRSVTEKNALDEPVRVSVVERPQVVIVQDQPNMVINESGVDLYRGDLNFLAPLDTEIKKESILKHDGKFFSVSEMELSPPFFGETFYLICRAERSHVNGSE